MTAIAHLTTEGDAHARGFAHGRRFAREIADNVATYLRRFAASGLDRDEAFAEAARWRKAIAGHNGAYAEEMRGVADGCGESEDAIALLNARYELAFTLFGQEASKGRRRKSCSNSASTAAPRSACCPRRPPIATPGSGRTGTGSKACMAAPSYCARGERERRVSSALPRPGSPAGKWGSTSAGSAWSKTVSPRATTAAIPIKSRSTCGAARCSTQSGLRRRRSR